MIKKITISIFLIAVFIVKDQSVVGKHASRRGPKSFYDYYGEKYNQAYNRPQTSFKLERPKKSRNNQYDYHYHYSNQPYAGHVYTTTNYQKQLESTGGGFTTNINQNNRYLPTFYQSVGINGRKLERETVTKKHKKKLSQKKIPQLQSTAGGFNANVNQNNKFAPDFANMKDFGALKLNLKGREIEVATDSNKQSDDQIKSSGGGFNANINQNNAFSPSFGNMGDIGGLKGKELGETKDDFSKIDEFLSKFSEDILAKYAYYVMKYFLKYAFPRGKPSQKPETFSDFRKNNGVKFSR